MTYSAIYHSEKKVSSRDFSSITDIKHGYNILVLPCRETRVH